MQKSIIFCIKMYFITTLIEVFCFQCSNKHDLRVRFSAFTLDTRTTKKGLCLHYYHHNQQHHPQRLRQNWILKGQILDVDSWLVNLLFIGHYTTNTMLGSSAECSGTISSLLVSCHVTSTASINYRNATTGDQKRNYNLEWQQMQNNNFFSFFWFLRFLIWSPFFAFSLFFSLVLLYSYLCIKPGFHTCVSRTHSALHIFRYMGTNAHKQSQPSQ